MKKGSITRYDNDLVLATYVDGDDLSAWQLEPVLQEIGGGGGESIRIYVPQQTINAGYGELSDFDFSGIDTETVFVVSVFLWGDVYIASGYYNPLSPVGFNSPTATFDPDTFISFIISDDVLIVRLHDAADQTIEETFDLMCYQSLIEISDDED